MRSRGAATEPAIDKVRHSRFLHFFPSPPSHPIRREEPSLTDSSRSLSLVFSYLLPHCEPDNPELAVDGRNIWRAREIGVYHQFSLEKRQHVFFVIHPSKKVRKRIEEFMVLPRTAKRDDAWEMIHALVLSSTCSLWPRYVDATEAHFQALVCPQFPSSLRQVMAMEAD